MVHDVDYNTISIKKRSEIAMLRTTGSISAQNPGGLGLPRAARRDQEGAQQDRTHERLACYWENVVVVTREVLDLRQGEDTTFMGKIPHRLV